MLSNDEEAEPSGVTTHVARTGGRGAQYVLWLRGFVHACVCAYVYMCVHVCIHMYMLVCMHMCGCSSAGRPGKGGKGLWACLEGREWPLQGSEEALPSSAISQIILCGSEAACYRGRKIQGMPGVPVSGPEMTGACARMVAEVWGTRI